MKKLLLFIVFVFSLSASAQIGFQEHVIVRNFGGISLPYSLHAADLDGDGDDDVLTASLNNDKIAWFENKNGSGFFGETNDITTEADGAWDVYAADLDGDGDMDAISADGYDSKISWYENLNGLGAFGPRIIISDATDFPFAVISADIDGDGDMDVISASKDDDEISWFENLDGNGNFGSQQIVSFLTDSAHDVVADDLDGDNDLDLVVASGNDDTISWFENLDGQGTYGPRILISTNADFAYSVTTSDIDGDGDKDVLSASYSDHKVAWYENTDGQGNFSGEILISSQVYFVRSVHSVDFDGDGDQDVISGGWDDPCCSSPDKLVWFENLDGQGDFGPEILISNTPNSMHDICSSDLDLDGDLDLLTTSTLENVLIWFKNTDGMGTVNEEHYIPTTSLAPKEVNCVDIDGDGDLDVLCASYGDDTVAWYENINGEGIFDSKRIVSNSIQRASALFSFDADGDLDYDFVSAAPIENRLYYHENIDGLGNFAEEIVIAADAYGVETVFALDLDGDLDKDILASASDGDKIMWYENVDGQGNFSSQKIIDSETENPLDVYAADIDGDGDNDIIAASFGDNTISWYENLDGTGTFGIKQLIANVEDASTVKASDIDGDGDMDIISGSRNENAGLCWYENLNGLGLFGNPRPIAELNAIRDIKLDDIDSDGDLDVVYAYGSRIGWHENMDGLGTFGDQNIISYAGQASSVSIGDLNMDGRLDVVSSSVFDHKVSWYENSDVLGTNHHASFKFDVYPVPTDGVVAVRSKSTIVKIKVYNTLGQLVLNNENQNFINLSTLDSGLYYLEILDEFQVRESKKVLKK